MVQAKADVLYTVIYAGFVYLTIRLNARSSLPYWISAVAQGGLCLGLSCICIRMHMAMICGPSNQNHIVCNSIDILLAWLSNESL